MRTGRLLGIWLACSLLHCGDAGDVGPTTSAGAGGSGSTATATSAGATSATGTGTAGSVATSGGTSGAGGQPGNDAGRVDPSDAAGGSGGGGSSPSPDAGRSDVGSSDTGGDPVVDAGAPGACGFARASFCHPGTELNGEQLAFVKAKIAAKQEPWTSALARAKASTYGSLGWTAKPRANVECGSGSNPNNGCSDERSGALAAYTHALLFALTGEDDHAKKAIEILNAWASVIREHTNSNAALQTGWSAVSFAKAGELLRSIYPAWADTEKQTFVTCLRDVYLPILEAGRPNTNGNWEAIMTEATLDIAVFLDDKKVFQRGLDLWRGRAPAYAYLESDGPYPKPPLGSNKDTPAELIAYWQGQSVFRDGLAQETCRDFGHTEWGIGALVNGAETAYQQGVDLYGEEAERLTKTLEFHANLVLGAPVPAWLCGGTVSLGSIPTFEMAYNHYHNRKEMLLPRTLGYLEQKVRTSATPVNYFIAWETLTHADVGAVGVPGTSTR